MEKEQKNDQTDSKPSEIKIAIAQSDPNEEALVKACKIGDIKEVQRLINIGVNVNCQINLQNVIESPLSAAIEQHSKLSRDRRQIVEYLLDNGADMEQKTSDNTTPLLKALSSEREEFAQILVERGVSLKIEDDLLRKSKNLPTVFTMIAEKFLLKDKNYLLRTISTIQLPCLIGSELIKKLLENDATINIDYSRSKNRQERDQIMLQHRRRRDWEQRRGWEQRRNRRIANEPEIDHEMLDDMGNEYEPPEFDQFINERLLQRYERDQPVNIDIGQQASFRKYQLIFWWSCEYGHKDVVECLVRNHQNDIDIDYQEPVTKETGLIIACVEKHKKIAEFLIDHGANLSLKDKKDKIYLDYLRAIKNDELQTECKDSLKNFYLKLKNSNQNELRHITLSSLLKKDLDEDGFIVKGEYLVNFELIDYAELVKNENKYTVFMVYFAGCEFKEKIICDIINMLKDFRDVLLSEHFNSLNEFLQIYMVDNSQFASSRNFSYMIRSIESKLILIDELEKTIESKQSFLVNLAKSMFREEIQNPLNEVDCLYEKYLTKDFYEKYISEKYFRDMGKNLRVNFIENDNCCLRVLSDEWYGHDRHYLDIRTEISLYLNKDPKEVDELIQNMENFKNFDESDVLKAFSMIYNCKINIYQVNKPLITIDCQPNCNWREISILFHKNIYASLIILI